MREQRSITNIDDHSAEFEVDLETIGHLVRVEIKGKKITCIMVLEGDPFTNNSGEDCQTYRFYEWHTRKLFDPSTQELCEETFEVEYKQ